MKELVPNKKSRLMPFAQSVQETLDKLDVDNGKMHISDGCIFEDGKFACISKGDIIEVVNIKTGLRSSACDFSTGDQKFIVTCVIPCKSRFLVGLQCNNSTNLGMVCIYDPGVSRVVKTIKLPAVPLSISIIREFGGVGYETSLLSDGLRCMFGIVAVGTEDGHLYLIDMRADDDGEDCSFIPLNTLLFIDTSSNGNAPKMRDKARLYGQYCCVDLTSTLFASTYFKYVDPDGNTIKMYDKGNCGITSLLYLPQSVSLVVGYSFGSFQIWSLKDLQIKYSSAVLVGCSPVSHFAFQEPENDPRHCCFLWVGRGPLPSQTECYSPTSITLYQMLYGIKQDIDGYGVLYKQLDVVARRFEHQLTADAHHLVDSTSVGSRIITFKTLDSSDSTVCMIVWETPINDANLSISCHLGIFDLNCYYEKQLPRSIRDAMYGKMEAVCPFFAFYSLTDIAEDFLPGGILDVFMDMKTLQWFRTNVAPQIEQFSWPSSASFKLTCLSEIGTIDVEMLGMQKQIIADMIKMGTDSFLDIGNLIESCCVAGLLQNSFGARQQSEDKSYPDALLSIALEHNGMIFITSCIKKWAHGSITHAGHSLKLVYDWAWSQVIQRKRMLDDLSTALFDSVLETLEAEQLNQLKTISSQLKDLSEILNELKHSNAITVDEGTQELEMRHQVTSHISMYTDILLLLVDCTLLPERVGYVDNSQSNKIMYNSNMLADYYEMHRTSSGNEDDLFIDLMWRGMEFPDEVKDENENDVLYPPQSVEIMCHLYIHNMSNDKEKTCCPFYYWFLDVCECYGQLRSKNVQSKFKQLLNLNYDDEMLVKSAWLIDHKLYHEASSQLLMIDVKISSLYYHHIVKLFYKHGEMDLLALFLANKEPNNCCTFEQVKFLICVLLQMGKLSNAYKLQTTILCASQKERLFNYFLQQCIQNKQLQRLMMLPLTMEEENMLHTYLVSSKGNEDYLLVYYLERGMFSKAQEVTKKLRAVSTVNLDQMNQEHLQTQCLLVEGFSQVIPEIQQKVNESMEKFPRDMTGSQNYKTPLSSLLIKGDPKNKKPVLYNSLFNSNMYDRSAIKKVLMNSTTRRRKSPLFDTEPVSPKKQKEMDASVMNIDMSVIDQSERRGSYDATNPFALLSTPVSAKRNYSRISSIGLSKRPQSILKLKPDVASEVITPVLSSNKRIRFVDLRSPTDSTSSLDGSFLENQSTTEIPVFASEGSETSIVSTHEDIVESENLISNAVKENDESLVASTPNNMEVAVEAVNETSAHIESILEDLQNEDEEFSDDLNTSKRLSLGAEESICEIMKLSEKLTPSTIIENVDHNVESQNELEAESSTPPTVDVIVEGDLPTESKYTPVIESPTESEITSNSGISYDTSLLVSDDALPNIPLSNVDDVLPDDVEPTGDRIESVVPPTEEGILTAVVQPSEDELTSEIMISTVDEHVSSSVVNLEQSFENYITDDSGPCAKASTPSEVPDSINTSQQISVADVSRDSSVIISNVEDATCVNVLSRLPSTPTQECTVTTDVDKQDNDGMQEIFSTPLEDPVHDKEFSKNDSMEIEPYTVSREQGEGDVAPANLVTHVEEISDDEVEEGDDDDSLGSSCEDESMSDSGEEEGNSFSDEKSVVSLSSSDSNDAQNVSFTSTDRGEDVEDDVDVIHDMEKAGSIKPNEGVSLSDHYSKIGSSYPPSDSGISLEDPQMKLSEISRSAESMVDILPGDVCDEEQGLEMKDKERESMCQIRDSGVFSRESMLSENSPDTQVPGDNEEMGSGCDDDVENKESDIDRGETSVTVADTIVHPIPGASTVEINLTTQPKPDDLYMVVPDDVKDKQVLSPNDIEPEEISVGSLETYENKENMNEMTHLDASEISREPVICQEEQSGTVDEVDDDQMNNVAMVADNSSVSTNYVADVGDVISNMPSDMASDMPIDIPGESESCEGIADVTEALIQANDQCEAISQQNDQVLDDADVCIIDDDDDSDEDDDGRDDEDVTSEDTDDSDSDDEKEEDNEEKIEDGDNFDEIHDRNLQNVVYTNDSFRKEVEGTCSQSTLSVDTSTTINTPFVVASTVAAPSVTDSYSDTPASVVLADDIDHDDDGDNEEVEAVENRDSPDIETFTDNELDYKPRAEGDSVNETDNKAYYKISYDDDDKAPSPMKERVVNQIDLSKIGSVSSPEMTTYPADDNLAVSNESLNEFVAESEDTRCEEEPDFEEENVQQVNLAVEDKRNVLISEDIEMKVSSSADDIFVTGSEHQLECIVASQDDVMAENEDEDEALSLNVVKAIDDADKPTISDDVNVESALEYDAESEVIPYSYNDENVSQTSNADLSEEDEKMEEVNLKKEDFREKMDWESNSEESESLPKTSTGKLPIFLPTKVTEESLIQKSSGDSSEEDTGSVITPVRALRRRTVYRKDTLTPRTNKFRVKAGDEASRDASVTSTNDSEKEVPILDSDAPVYHTRYDNAKNIHEMKKESNVRSDKKEGNKRSSHPRRPTRRNTRSSGRSLTVALEKDDSHTSNSERLNKEKNTEGKKKVDESSSKYFKKVDGAESSSDDIEIQSKDLEVYLGLTRRKARRTRKSLKSGVSPILEENVSTPSPRKPDLSLKNVIDEVTNSSQDKKILSQMVSKEEEDIDQNADTDDGVKRQIEVSELPPEKRLRLNQSFNDLENSAEDNSNDNSKNSEKPAIESTDDSTDDDDSPPSPRVTRGQSRASARQTRSHDVSVQPQLKATPRSRKKSPSKNSKSSSKTSINKSTVEKTPVNDSKIIKKREFDIRQPEIILERRSFSHIKKLGDDDEEEDNEELLEETYDFEGSKNNMERSSEESDGEAFIPRVTRSKRDSFSEDQSVGKSSVNTKSNIPTSESTITSQKMALRRGRKVVTKDNSSTVSENISLATDATSTVSAVKKSSSTTSLKPRIMNGRFRKYNSDMNISTTDVNPSSFGEHVSTVDTTKESLKKTTKRRQVTSKKGKKVMHVNENISSSDELSTSSQRAIETVTSEYKDKPSRLTRTVSSLKISEDAIGVDRPLTDSNVSSAEENVSSISERVSSMSISSRRTRTGRLRRDKLEPVDKIVPAGDDRLSGSSTTLADLSNTSNDVFPKKRVGRPRKNTTEILVGNVTSTDESISTADRNVSLINERVSRSKAAMEESFKTDTVKVSPRKKRAGRSRKTATVTVDKNVSSTDENVSTVEENISVVDERGSRLGTSYEEPSNTLSHTNISSSRNRKGRRTVKPDNENFITRENVLTTAETLEESVDDTLKSKPSKTTRTTRSRNNSIKSVDDSTSTNIVSNQNIGERAPSAAKLKSQVKESTNDDEDELESDISEKQQGRRYLKKLRGTTRSTRATHRAMNRHSASESVNNSELIEDARHSEGTVDTSSQDETIIDKNTEIELQSSDTLTSVTDVPSPSYSESVKDETTDISPEKDSRKRYPTRRGGSRKENFEIPPELLSEIYSSFDKQKNTSKSKNTKQNTSTTKIQGKGKGRARR